MKSWQVKYKHDSKVTNLTCTALGILMVKKKMWKKKFRLYTVYSTFWSHGFNLTFLTLESVVTQSCLTLCNPMNCSPPGSCVHGILLASTLEWIAIPFSRGFSQTRHQTCVSHTASRFFIIWVTRAALVTSSAISKAQGYCEANMR